MTPNAPTTFKFSPSFGIGQLVWHRGCRESCGVVEAIVLLGRDDYRYRISWGALECTEERETTLSDEPPAFDGVSGGEN